MNELLWMGPAFIAGIAAVRIGLPPMVGYLLCGFILNLLGVFDHEFLTMIGDLGVTLLLFTIGLKLDSRLLFRPVIWAGTTLHTTLVTAIFGTLLYWLSLAGIQAFAGISIGTALLIGFALSFSSTVFAVKTLEDKGDYQSRYGQIAIGILIMQDIFAVVFLAASTGKLPSIWALALLTLIPLRFLLFHLMSRAGHSAELQTLFGIAMAFGAYTLFDAVDVKGDLGALLIGAMLASHPMAGEVSKRLLGFKDILLVGFFLSIGMSGSLTVSALLVAMLLTLVAIFKVGLFFAIFTRFKLRARTSMLSSMSLATYSEFGLIVGAIAVSNAWLSADWLIVIALALTMTIIIAAPVNMRAVSHYERVEATARKFEIASVSHEDDLSGFGDAKIAIVGMGRLGVGVYDQLSTDYGDLLLGMDSNPDVVTRHKAAGRNVISANATDDEMWDRVNETAIEVVIVALKHHKENLGVVARISERNPTARLFAVASHQDEVVDLIDAGAAAAWNMYSEAGAGLASEVVSYYRERDLISG